MPLLCVCVWLAAAAFLGLARCHLLPPQELNLIQGKAPEGRKEVKAKRVYTARLKIRVTSSGILSPSYPSHRVSRHPVLVQTRCGKEAEVVKKRNLAARSSPLPLPHRRREQNTESGAPRRSDAIACERLVRPPVRPLRPVGGGGGTPTLFTPESLKREEVREGRKNL